MRSLRSSLLLRIAFGIGCGVLPIACSEQSESPTTLTTIEGDLLKEGFERAAPLTANPPNIILLLADDVGWSDLSGGQTSMGNGSIYHQTPNLDRLASEGMAFTRAYALQNCAPTRTALLTGQYETRTGAYNTGTLNRASGDTLLVGPVNTPSIEPTAVTLAETLKRAGYTTAHFGKFHSTRSVAHIVNHHGFDHNYGGLKKGGLGGYFASLDSGSWRFSSNVGREMDAFAAPYTPHYVTSFLAPFANGNDPSGLVGTPKHLSDAMADAAVRFMQEQVELEQPFFMQVAFNAVHIPLEPRPDLGAKYKLLLSADPRHRSASHAALLEGMDQAIGRIIAFVDDPNHDGDPEDSLAATTLILFLSDNGAPGRRGGSKRNGPLRGAKGTMYEGGNRVPMIARLTGIIPAGSVSDELVHVVDLYPTLSEIAQATLPSPSVHPLDGESFARILTGGTTGLGRDAIYHHFPGYLDRRATPCSTIIKDIGGQSFKLFYFYEDGHYEMYDLSTDPGESMDLLAPGRMTQASYDTACNLSADLRSWLDATGAVYPTVRGTEAAVGLPGGSPPLTFALDRTAAPGLHANVSAKKSLLGLTLSLKAVGGIFHQSGAGVGVDSTADDGLSSTEQPLIDSTVGERIEISFDRPVVLKSVDLASLDENESVVLTVARGPNPFGGLTGYTDEYFIRSASVTYTSGEAAGTTRVRFGHLGQEPIAVAAGVILAIGVDSPVGGGFMLEAISVERSCL